MNTQITNVKKSLTSPITPIDHFAYEASQCIKLDALDITPISLYIVKRFLQLLKNESSRELILNGIHRSILNTLDFIEITDKHLLLGATRYEGYIKSACDPNLLESDTIYGTTIKHRIKIFFIAL